MINKKMLWLLIGIFLHFNMAVAGSSFQDVVQRAKKLQIENLGSPINTVRFDKVFMVPNSDGETWDFLLVYYPSYGGPHEIVIIDGASGKIKHVRIPREESSPMFWHMAPSVIAGNGKLFISTGGKTQYLHIYNPEDNSLKVSAVRLPAKLISPGHGHQITLGPDGKIYYAAGYGKNNFGACQIDPDTLKVIDYGPLGDSKYGKNLPWHIAVDKTHLYVVGAKLPWSLATYNLKTGKTVTLFKSKLEMWLTQNPYGCTLTVRGKNGGPYSKYWLNEGKMVPFKETPPSVLVQLKKKHEIRGKKPEIFTRQAAQPGVDGKYTLWVRTLKAKGMPGKLYKTPEEAGWRRYSYKVDTTPCVIQRIITLPDGRIFGSGVAYGGTFIYNPATNKYVNFGENHISIYTLSIHNDTVFFSGYPSSTTFAYNFKKPLTNISGSDLPGVISLASDDPKRNPYHIGFLKKEAGTHKMYASAVGSDGCVYFGGRMIRNGSGGGIAWFDTKTGKKNGISDIFSNYQVRYMTAVDDGRYIIISTYATDDVVLGKKRPKSGRLFVFDTNLKKIIKTIDPVPECDAAGIIVGVDRDHILGLTYPRNDRNNAKIYRVNIKTGNVAFVKKVELAGIPCGLNLYGNQNEAFDFCLGPDKKVWTFLGGRVLALVKIKPESGEIEIVGKLPFGDSGHIAFSGNDLYLANKTQLRKIPNILK